MSIKERQRERRQLQVADALFAVLFTAVAQFVYTALSPWLSLDRFMLPQFIAWPLKRLSTSNFNLCMFPSFKGFLVLSARCPRKELFNVLL